MTIAEMIQQGSRDQQAQRDSISRDVQTGAQLGIAIGNQNIERARIRNEQNNQETVLRMEKLKQADSFTQNALDAIYQYDKAISDLGPNTPYASTTQVIPEGANAEAALQGEPVYTEQKNPDMQKASLEKSRLRSQRNTMVSNLISNPEAVALMSHSSYPNEALRELFIGGKENWEAMTDEQKDTLVQANTAVSEAEAMKRERAITEAGDADVDVYGQKLGIEYEKKILPTAQASAAIELGKEQGRDARAESANTTRLEAARISAGGTGGNKTAIAEDKSNVISINAMSNELIGKNTPALASGIEALTSSAGTGDGRATIAATLGVLKDISSETPTTINGVKYKNNTIEAKRDTLIAAQRVVGMGGSLVLGEVLKGLSTEPTKGQNFRDAFIPGNKYKTIAERLSDTSIYTPKSSTSSK